jgi:hypothetical protein
MIEIPLVYLPLIIMVFFWIISFIANGFSLETKTEMGFLLGIISVFVSFVVIIIYLVKLVIFLFEHIKFV